MTSAVHLAGYNGEHSNKIGGLFMSFDKIIGYAQTKKALLPLLQMLQGDKRYN